MKIILEKVLFEINREEAIEVYWALREKLIKAVENHWIKHPDSFQQQETSVLEMLKVLGKFVQHESFQDIMYEIDVLLHNKGSKPLSK